MTQLICDWKAKGNLVRLYCCDADTYNEVWGDDWDDVPFEYNAGMVYDKYVDCVVDLYFSWHVVILEPQNDWTYKGGSPFSKKSFKEGEAPIFIAYQPQEDDYWDGSEYHQIIGCKNSNHVLKFYMGDDIYTMIAGLDKKFLPHIEIHKI